MADILHAASVWVIPVLSAVVFHELAHGLMADALGDRTARLAGRLTLNPVKHIDPVGTVILPGLLLAFSSPFLFGWARPVPVNAGNFPRPRQGMALVALAGPAMNVALAFVSFMLLWLIDDSGWWPSMLWNSCYFNIVLAVFNMIPLLPLDGGRVVAGILPEALAIRFMKMERIGFGVLIGLLIILPLIGQKIGVDLNFLSSLVTRVVRAVVEIFFMMAG
ncbi:site-2 protease family protein [Haematospirillum sp. H1815]|nr:site-2 protease family protein [Haematospirillum sp. H1815]